MADKEPRGEAYETQHVHTVYEEIASHFSSTRYKPWPIVESFLKGLPDGSIGADVGCGNGKYLAVNPRVFIVGSDRSTNLVKIAKAYHSHSVIVADSLSLPHPSKTFDFAISIAVIHHLSTPERRIEAVRAVLDILRPPSSVQGDEGGKALIYVWALEQKDSRRGWDEGHEQDVMVPWVLKGKREKKPSKKRQSDDQISEDRDRDRGMGGQGEDKTFLRYYHLYRKGELEGDIEEAGGRILGSGYEKDNWWAIAVSKMDS
ncbi:S-adenosyl-L-methionine-dependent methyltransferase [Lindgomyces ingoldianus]|uniref:S-adenosyl-L-methionine-dependent methyltransferase n=1 Tax=Lindgomyces ingoldianus TaxID=673940 RepID=A0ACB6Q781_9PLEO|nr:S-adenosyl-L-methionine-dependent methyltransferase [Lindgomyces ingoldianus]KAF2462671.1 S-adenosyl-L-methionine-dependent methyltransferase [Lindgomyces ingoldianus]